MNHGIVVAVLFVVLLLSCPALLPAQTTNATVTGFVTDPAKAFIVGAKVNVINMDTNIRYTVTTNQEGSYTVPNLAPGPYRIEVEKPGFKTVVKSDLVLHVQDTAAVNFQMAVGSVSETVTVQAGGLVMNTTDASVSTVIDRNFAGTLPLNGRSFNTLLQLTPGVVIAPSNSDSPGQFSVNGQRTNGNYFQVDGVSVNFGATTQGPLSGSYQVGGGGSQAFNVFGGTGSLVSVDALQEFRVETSSFAPEFGHTPGGQVIIETRSGTNSFHGDVFDYFRNTVLDAANWFNNAAGLPRTPEHQNDFGGVLGGPIWKNKTFFFISYEGLRLLQPETTITSVPSLSIRTAPTTSPAAVPFLDTYPQPNGIDHGDGTAQFTGAYNNRIQMDAGSARIDQVLNSKWTLFGRFNYAPSNSLNRATSVLSELDQILVDTTTITVGATGMLTPTVTNSFRFNFSRQSAGTVSHLDSFGGAVPLDTSLLLPSPLTSSKNVGDFSVFDTGGFATGIQAKNHEDQWNILESVSFNLGKHQLKVGGDYRLLNYFQSGTPTLLFLQSFTTQGFASAAQVDRLFYEEFLSSHIRLHFLSLYAEDIWKVTPKLSLTYGLRWEFNPPPSGTNGTVLAAWQNTGAPEQTVLAPLGAPLWKTRYNDFAPRIGVAYDLTSNGNLVIRAGAGVFYDLGTGIVPLLGNAFPNSGFNFVPGPLSVPITNVTQYAPVLSSQPPYSSPTGFADNLKLPRSYQWNVALEKSFLGEQAVSVTYLGQIGRDLLRTINELQPNANFAPGTTFGLTANGDRSSYNSLQVQYRRPLSRNVQALVNYTWSHCIDTNSQDAFPVTPGSLIPVSGDRGSCDFDVRNNFTAAVTYALPRFTEHRFLGQIINNWSLNGVAQARSGFPINVTYYNFSFPGLPAGTLLRPDVVPGQPFLLYGSQCDSVYQDLGELGQGQSCPGGKGLNPAAFDSTTPSNQNRQGNLGRNAIQGFGAIQVDLSVMRRFPITERLNLQFRADAFNVLNHPNFFNPSGELLFNPSFGIATQMLGSGLGGLTPLYQIGGPRSLQLSLKLDF